jgi:hypothetical protein
MDSAMNCPHGRPLTVCAVCAPAAEEALRVQRSNQMSAEQPVSPSTPIQGALAEMEQQVIDQVLNHEPPLLRVADVHALRSILHPHTMRVAREVFMVGVEWGMMQPDRPDEAIVERVARAAFPLPPRKVLREEPDPHGYGEWRVMGGALQWRDSGGKLAWTDPRDIPSSGPVTVEPVMTVDRCLLVADLVANPYREEPQ